MEFTSSKTIGMAKNIWSTLRVLIFITTIKAREEYFLGALTIVIRLMCLRPVKMIGAMEVGLKSVEKMITI